MFIINSAENAVMITEAEFEKKLTTPTTQTNLGNPNTKPSLFSEDDDRSLLFSLFIGKLANYAILLTHNLFFV
jgi:hypothetical protein